MEAKVDDFEKVMVVVRKQLLAVLDLPVKEIPTTVENFKVPLSLPSFILRRTKCLQVFSNGQITFAVHSRRRCSSCRTKKCTKRNYRLCKNSSSDNCRAVRLRVETMCLLP